MCDTLLIAWVNKKVIERTYVERGEKVFHSESPRSFQDEESLRAFLWDIMKGFGAFSVMQMTETGKYQLKPGRTWLERENENDSGTSPPTGP